jgi:hypothetical protein
VTDRALLGAHLAGWPAFVVDVLLKRHLGPYMAAMTSEQRAAVERAHAAIHAAALHWRASGSGSAEPPVTAQEQGLIHDEISIAEAAELLAVSERYVRGLAVGWAREGLARKPGGRAWLIDRQAVLLHRQQTRGAA